MDIHKIIFDSTLYQKFTNSVMINEDGEEMEYSLEYLITHFEERVEQYCTKCGDKRIFTPDRVYKDAPRVPNMQFAPQLVRNEPTLYKTFRCSLNAHHKILYGFLVDGDKIIKIAEYPSKYDSVKDGFNKYESVISKENISELAKASQLESYGYAIGAFLYYRRIFENLIIKTFVETDIQDKISEEEFRKKRMDSKIEYIQEHLPDYFNENSHIYGTLSKGIHELQEEECREYLPIVQTIIYFSLDEAVDKRNKELRKKEFAKKLKNINSKL
ncbi:hypothetical protein [Winogradskyella immobilis]|jgi:hypothetical protein|uniref:Short-chain dehydrogenase n=1 Tax=Winogradskyella immobilis TaxID=2816852 RepID=A0ABS8ETH8_9FLAO|nr:hypothetical protein [Winogradskyella immobilis]MCC1485577.1 hypothetical protein [Winogradskyella immobilis]MCG0017669.1 hypothetical protein [Winogradskyella immobilis]